MAKKVAVKKVVAKKSAKSGSGNRMTIISGRAKELRLANPKMEWTDAIKKASALLVKEGKL